MSVSVFDATKPATNSAEASAELRNNFAALQSSLDGNLVADPYVEWWGAGDSSAPTHYVYTAGTGAPTIARAGTGLGDTALDTSGLGWNGGNLGPIGTNWGAFCAKMVFGTSTSTLRQMILGATGVKSFVGQPFSAGAWVKTSTANAIRINLWDGVANNYSSYHTGNGQWQWLTCTMASGISNTATGLWIYANNEAGTVYVNGFVVVMGSVPPVFFVTAPIVRFELPLYVSGALSVANTLGGEIMRMTQPCAYRETQLAIGTAPTTTAVIIRPNKTNAAIYATNPQIAAAANVGNGGQPDGTYANRFFAHNDYLSIDATQVGIGTTGSNLVLMAGLERYVRPTLHLMTIAESVNG